MADTTVSKLVANNPDGQVGEIANQSEAEEAMKTELLKELSLADVRNLLNIVRNGLPKTQTDYPDEFDEQGRNFRRMVHRHEMVGTSGHSYFIERPMANSLEDARKNKADYFNPELNCWILYGTKRQRDYPENTVEGFAATHV